MIFLHRIFLHWMFLHWMSLHRISRMNRKAILLIGLLTDFRGTLAAGQWLAPEVFPCCFCPTDFTDYHRYYMESLVNLFIQSQGVSATTGQVASAKIRE